MDAPESIRALKHFPACTVIVGQFLMSATVTWLFEDSPPCLWGSLLGDGSISLKDLSPLPSHWSDHRICNNQCVYLHLHVPLGMWSSSCPAGV